jgi:hypothetical protein
VFAPSTENVPSASAEIAPAVEIVQPVEPYPPPNVAPAVQTILASVAAPVDSSVPADFTPPVEMYKADPVLASSIT